MDNIKIMALTIIVTYVNILYKIFIIKKLKFLKQSNFNKLKIRFLNNKADFP